MFIAAELVKLSRCRLPGSYPTPREARAEFDYTRRGAKEERHECEVNLKLKAWIIFSIKLLLVNAFEAPVNEIVKR